MAEEQVTQQTAMELSFPSEDARAQAMEALPDTPEALSELDKIRAAPIRDAEAATGTTPPAPATEIAHTAQQTLAGQTAAAAPMVAPSAPPAHSTGTTPPANPQAGQFWQIPTTELPKGPNGETYATPQQFLKAFKEQGELISRQQTFIREKVGTGAPPALQQQLADAQARADRAEKLLESTRATTAGSVPVQGAPAVAHAATAAQAPQTQQAIADGEARAGKLLTLLKEIEDSEDYLDPAVAKKQQTLMRELIQTQNELTSLYKSATSEIGQIATLRKEFDEIRTLARSQKEREEQAAAQRRAEEALASEFKTMAEFSELYPEFKLSKDPRVVDAEYADWGKQVGRLYYGREPNLQEVHYALGQLQLKSPTLLNACMVAGVPVEPSADIQAYLNICELLDYQDGKRKDPATGHVIEAKRFDTRTNQYVIDRYPSGIEGLRAAYEYRKVTDGVYANQIAQARTAGAQSALRAAQQRDFSAVQIGSEAGTGALTGVTSAADIVNRRNAIDEEQAVMLARRGDTSLLDEYNRLQKALGSSIIEAPVPGYHFAG